LQQNTEYFYMDRFIKYSQDLVNRETLGIFSFFLVKYLISVVQDLPLTPAEDVIDMGIESWGP